jgi:large conductance mechanosensitive channel
VAAYPKRDWRDGMWTEFKAFLLKTNALALAIGVIIGTALGTVVTSLVNDIIMPPIGLVLGGIDFSQLKWVLQNASGSDPKAAGYVAEVAIRYGTFINFVIAFVVIAFVVWRISKMLIKEEPAAAAPPSKTCPYCKEANAVDASKCRACTSAI